MHPPRFLPSVVIPCRDKRSGFTLLEVLVALAVVSLALAALIKAAAQAAENTAYLRDKTLAHWVAMNRITEYQVYREWPATGTRTGASEMAGREWAWTITIENTMDPDTRRLQVEVRREEEQEYPLVELTAFLARP
jgi:general secretion pathway protein I